MGQGLVYRINLQSSCYKLLSFLKMIKNKLHILQIEASPIMQHSLAILLLSTCIATTTATITFKGLQISTHRRIEHLQKLHALPSHNGRHLLNKCAVAIPGNGLPEQIFVGGFGNFLSVYNVVITARILLSWFPQVSERSKLAL